jgi:hypothetical protein
MTILVTFLTEIKASNIYKISNMPELLEYFDLIKIGNVFACHHHERTCFEGLGERK